MNIEVVTASFLPLEEAIEAMDWTWRVVVRGSGMIARAIPLQARIGDLPVDQLFILPNDEGFAGVLTREPDAGARLFVGYIDEEEFDTGIDYQPLPLIA